MTMMYPNDSDRSASPDAKGNYGDSLLVFISPFFLFES